MKVSIIAITAMVFANGSASANEMDKLAAKLKSGDFSEVKTTLTQLAQKGDPRAQFNLGVAYYYGNGVEQNSNEAQKWYEKAASNGNARAEVNLAALHLGSDPTRAINLYERAAKHGDVEAYNALGRIYKYGAEPVKQDYAKAFKYYSFAANKGSADAKFHLADMYLFGRGTKKDVEKSVRLYSQLAGIGNERATLILADLYEYGTLVKKDLPRALAWYLKLANNHVANSKAEEISTKLSAEQMTQTSAIIEDIKLSERLYTDNKIN